MPRINIPNIENITLTGAEDIVIRTKQFGPQLESDVVRISDDFPNGRPVSLDETLADGTTVYENLVSLLNNSRTDFQVKIGLMRMIDFARSKNAPYSDHEREKRRWPKLGR
jgi:hypothetical protein